MAEVPPWRQKKESGALPVCGKAARLQKLRVESDAAAAHWDHMEQLHKLEEDEAALQPGRNWTEWDEDELQSGSTGAFSSARPMRISGV